MGLNDTPSADRIHIGIFGNRNAGKSSVVNAITGQKLSIVSDTMGTTTDPVYKAMELLPLGPVIIIDTPGLDDEGELGEMRVKSGYQVLNKTDIAVLVVDGTSKMNRTQHELISTFKKKNIPFIIAINKSDHDDFCENVITDTLKDNIAHICVSTKTGSGIHELKEMIAKTVPLESYAFPIISDLLNTGDIVVLVVPIDSAAPKGRLILPQQQTIRDILEAGALNFVCRETELITTLNSLKYKPKMVVTDSQAFKRVAKETPDDVMLTSFSILMARHKGNLADAVAGASMIEKLKNGDTILISEGCTHHRQCNDIGTVKLPKWIRDYTSLDINFEFTSGREFPDDLSKYALIVHCGACMLNEREMKYRYRIAKENQVPITNYGTMIAYINGILKRSLEPFPDIARLIK